MKKAKNIDIRAPRTNKAKEIGIALCVLMFKYNHRYAIAVTIKGPILSVRSFMCSELINPVPYIKRIEIPGIRTEVKKTISTIVPKSLSP
jgi:hypothetical protein